MSIIRKSLNIAGNDHWEADAGAKTGSPRRSEPGRSLREEYSRQRRKCANVPSGEFARHF